MNEFLSILASSWNYMREVPYFWLAMGTTVAISMLISPLLFDGDMKLALKALWAKLLYFSMLLWISISQIIDARFNHPELITPNIKPVTYVTALNLLATTTAWLLGLVLGIMIIKIKYHNKLHKF